MSNSNAAFLVLQDAREYKLIFAKAIFSAYPSLKLTEVIIDIACDTIFAVVNGPPAALLKLSMQNGEIIQKKVITNSGGSFDT